MTQVDKPLTSLSRGHALNALAGLSAAVGTVSDATSAAGGTTSQEDAELIRLCKSLIEERTTFNADSGAKDDDPRYAALADLQDRIAALPAATLAGVVALAQVAEHFAEQPGGFTDWDTAFVGAWPRRVCNNLLTLFE